MITKEAVIMHDEDIKLNGTLAATQFDKENMYIQKILYEAKIEILIKEIKDDKVIKKTQNS